MRILEKLNNEHRSKMRDELKDIFIRGCNKKIEKKGENVGLSFYAFFKNKNDNPELGGNLIIIDLLHVLP